MSWLKDRWHGILDNALYDWGWRVIVWASPLLLSASYWLLAWLGKVPWSSLFNAALLLVAIVLIGIGIWRTGTPKKRKHHAAAVAPPHSSDKPAGGLIGRIPHAAFFDGPNERDGVVVALEITNRGDPTIVDRWGLVIELDGRKFQYRATHFQKDFTIWDNEGHPVKLEPSQMLYERVGNTPIPKGGRQLGYLIFLTKDISFERLKAARPRLRVIFSDAFGNEYVAESSSESTGTILYQPGLNDPFGQILIREAVLAKPVQPVPLRPIEIRDALDGFIGDGERLLERWNPRNDAIVASEIDNQTLQWLTAVAAFVKRNLDVQHVDQLNQYQTTVKSTDRWNFSFNLAKRGVDINTHRIAYELGYKLQILRYFRDDIR